MSSRVVDISPARLVLILAATFLVLSAATWFTLIAPKQSKAQSLDTTIKNAQSHLAQLTHNEATVQKHAVSESLMLERALPSITAMPQIVLQLSRIATEEHVSLDSITPQTPVLYSGYQAVPITVTLDGDFFNIEGFLQQLREQVRAAGGVVTATGRLYDVLGVTLQSTTPAPRVSATLTIDAFSYTGFALAPDSTTPPPA
jgi:Tfp pilus assembly protein PilO